jgi:hypothetical protein
VTEWPGCGAGDNVPVISPKLPLKVQSGVWQQGFEVENHSTLWWKGTKTWESINTLVSALKVKKVQTQFSNAQMQIFS